MMSSKDPIRSPTREARVPVRDLPRGKVNMAKKKAASSQGDRAHGYGRCTHAAQEETGLTYRLVLLDRHKYIATLRYSSEHWLAQNCYS